MKRLTVSRRDSLSVSNPSSWLEITSSCLRDEARAENWARLRPLIPSFSDFELFKAWKTAFPDAVGTVTSAVATGNKAALEVTWKGTHTGPLGTAEGTIPASGKHQETPAAFFLTFEGDKIKQSRHYFDSLTLLKQIGAQPK